MDRFRMSLVAQEARQEAERSEPVLSDAAAVLEEHEELMRSGEETRRLLDELREKLYAAWIARTKKTPDRRAVRQC
jgi:hypothetical protein